MRKVLSLFVVVAVMLAVGTVWAQEEGKKKERKRPSVEDIFKKLDADSDGKLTKDEFLKSPRFKDDAAKERGAKQFEKMDADKSGDVSLDEFKEAFEKMAEGHKKGGKKGKKAE